MANKRIHPARVAELGLSGKVGSPHYFHGGMRKFFKIGDAGKYVDVFLLMAGVKELKINIIMFDDWLHKQIGDYESRGLSMKDAIAREYGEQAELFIQSLI